MLEAALLEELFAVVAGHNDHGIVRLAGLFEEFGEPTEMRPLCLEEEIEARRQAGYPPFGRLAALIVSGASPAAALAHARALAAAASSASASAAISSFRWPP